MGVVVEAVLGNAAGEIDHGLFLIERAKHFHGGFERGQLPVGIEDVEFGIVLYEGGAGVGGAVVASGLVEALAGADAEVLDVFGEKVAIVGEILNHVDVAGEGHEGHQVGRGHLILEELLRFLLSA